MAEEERLTSLIRGDVLLIDDDADFRAELKEMLESERLSVVALESSSHCIRFVQNQSWNWYPWLMITDIVMGGMGGFQLMRRIQEYYPKREIPIIVVSRLTSGTDICEAEIAGAAAYIAKPVKKDVLVSTIRKVFTRKDRRIVLTQFEQEQDG